MESLEEKYLEAIRALKSELRQLLGPEEAERLNRRLGQYLRWARSPARRERALTRALAAIREHPRVRDRLAEILRREGVEEPYRLYEPLPGEGGEIPAGTLMVCPVDPKPLPDAAPVCGPAAALPGARGRSGPGGAQR